MTTSEVFHPRVQTAAERVSARESICAIADRLVGHRVEPGERQSVYGHPLDDYSRTAGMASAMLAAKLREPLTAEDVIRLMILVKLSRDQHCGMRDNRIDTAGYAKCLDLCEEERGLRARMAKRLDQIDGVTTLPPITVD